jgi:hypothetical protein
MNRPASALGLALALAFHGGLVAGPDAARRYPNYYAARDAIERGDCREAVRYLNAFLREHPYVRERYPDFYAEVRYGIGQCSDTVTVRGIGGDSSELDPLPDDPPMVEREAN